MGKKIVFLLASLFTVWIANGQNTIIKGVVTDSITGEDYLMFLLYLKERQLEQQLTGMATFHSPL